MSEYLNDPKIFWTLIALVAIFATTILFLLLPKKKKSKEIVTSEWQPTGKIDFHCVDAPKDDTVPATFVLRVEDFRTVESISGVEHMEIRWRNTTLAEAKFVVVAHQNATDTRTKNYRFRKHRASEIDQGGDQKLPIPTDEAPTAPPSTSGSSHVSQ
jgi:hypothetical protein